MKPQPRNYNLLFAAFISVIGILLFGFTISGQLFYLNLLPEGDLGMLQKATASEIIHLDLTQNIIEISLPQAGDYRVISSDKRLYAAHLTVHSKTTAEEIPRIIADRTKYAPYETELLQGDILFNFNVDDPGTYELHIHNLNLNQINPTITIFPDYTAQNRQRILFTTTPLFVLLIVTAVWFGRTRPALSKKQRQAKQNKWDEFTKED
jgi:hypothetical protein